MSIALIVTRGYGNGALTGTIADVATRGYSIGEEVIDDSVTGGWLSPEQIKNLRRLMREADNLRDKSKARRRKQAAIRLGDLENIYDRIHGLIPAQAAAQVREIVEPFSAPSDAPVPPPAAVDFTALLQDMGAVKALATTLIETSKLRDEEEEALMLLMMA